MKLKKLGLLPKVLIAICLGVLLGLFVPDWFTRIFLTFNGIFSQLLGFMIPLIIVGLVTAAIGDLGHGAGKMLLVTVLIAYLDTVIVALGGFGVGNAMFPSIVAKVGSAADLTEAAILHYQHPCDVRCDDGARVLVHHGSVHSECEHAGDEGFLC